MNEFLWPVRVYYEDTDAGGVVYHSNHLKYMERARTEWLRELGFEQDELIARHNVIFAVRHVAIDYLLPARFNDALEVSLTLVELKKVSLTLAQEIKRHNDASLLCKAAVQVVSLVASTLKPIAIPGEIRDAALQRREKNH